MPDTRARHRLPRGERRRVASRQPLVPVAPAARRCAPLLPVVLLLLLAPPAAAVGPVICSDPAIGCSTGDPDDGEHRELPELKPGAAATLTSPDVALPAAVSPSPAAAPGARGPVLRPGALRRARFLGQVALWSALRTWFLHR